MRVWMALTLTAMVVGCGGEEAKPPPKNASAADHAAHGTGGQDQHAVHGGHEADVARRVLKIKATPSQPVVGSPTKLELSIQDADGTTIKQFDVLHEKRVHLIVVRDGLDQFAHLHPDVGDSGISSVDFTFPKSGKYRLFADHQPQGLPPGLATGELTVGGTDEPAVAPVPSMSDEVSVDGIKARVAMKVHEAETVVRFHLVDATDQSITDLQPYLGAMGHLVIISASGNEYIHAHPLSEAKTAPDGVVEFAAHFAMPGIYKAWGQFQRNGAIVTVPFVFEHKPTGAAHSTRHAGGHDSANGKQDDPTHSHSHIRGKMMIADAGPYHLLLTAHLAAATGNELDVFIETPDSQNPKPVAIPVESFEAQATSGEGESQSLKFEPASSKERPAGETAGSYSHFVAKAPWMKPEDDLLVVAKFKIDGKEYVARWKSFIPKRFAHHAE